MAINLSDLTGASTSGDILAEAQSTADFLDSCPLLKNLADPSGATDAKQFTATKQPKALPLIDGDGYCYLPNTVNNTVSTPDDSSLDITGDITLEIDLTLKDWLTSTNRNLVSKYNTSGGQRSYRLYLDTFNKPIFVISSNGAFQSQGVATCSSALSFSDHQRAQLRAQWRSSDERVQFFTSTDKGQTWTQLGTDEYTSGISSIYSGTADLDIGHRTNADILGNAAIHSVKVYDSITPSSSSLRFNCDFTAPNIRHGDTAFECATGQVITINQSNNDPATVIKKPVLRFDGVDDFMDGVFGQTIDSGYMFAAFSVLGAGGSESSGRIFGVYPAGAADTDTNGSIFSLRGSTTANLRTYIKGNWRALHTGLFDDANGDILHESLISNGNQVSRVNNADESTTTVATTTQATDFSISASSALGNSNTAIDLEYLGLFPATLTDSQADAVRSYINNRNFVFLRHHTDGYYFYNPQSLADGGVLSWNGRIVGSDNGDADLLAAQSTSADRPTKSGLSVTFADNTDHLDIPSTTQAGWQIVGSSIGTFVYKVNANAVTELNLLGNAVMDPSSNVYREAGDLYGIILLPENATNREIQEVRKLFIDRGASDSAPLLGYFAAWFRRSDIVEFNDSSFPNVTSLSYAWATSTNMTRFGTLNAPNCTNFAYTWNGCSSLTSFPSGAKLGTEASNVNFDGAWQSSGLTSFSTSLPTATSLGQSWRDCTSLTSFNVAELPAVTVASQAWRSSGLTSFSTLLPNAHNVYLAWYNCQSLTSFDSSLSSMRNARQAWQSCISLTDFSAGVFDNWNPSIIQSSVFNGTWDNCTSLTAQSVENILTSIAASGKYATSTGLDGGSALADAIIDIDYDVSTGSLTAATTSAITTLKSRGWGININNVLQ